MAMSRGEGGGGRTKGEEKVEGGMAITRGEGGEGMWWLRGTTPAPYCVYLPFIRPSHV